MQVSLGVHVDVEEKGNKDDDVPNPGDFLWVEC